MRQRYARWVSFHVPALVFALLMAVFFAIHQRRERVPGVSPGAGWARDGLLVWIAFGAFVSILAWTLLRDAARSRRAAVLARAREQEVLDGVSGAVLVVDDGGRIARANVALLEVAGVSPVLSVGTKLADLPLLTEDGERISWPAEGHLRGRMERTRSMVDVDVSVRPLAGQPGTRLVHIHDISRELADLRRITRQQQELRVLADLGCELNRVTSESALLELALEQIARLVSIAGAGGIFVVDREAAVLRLSASYGLEPGFVAAEQEVPLGECLCGEAAVSGKPCFSGSSSSDACHTRHRFAAPHGHFVLPLRTANEIVGVLFLYLHEGVRVDNDWHRLLEGVASEVALALMRIREHSALSQSEQRLERLFEEAPDAMLVTDSAGVVLRASRRARRWLNVGESIAGRLPWERVLAMSAGRQESVRVEVRDGAGRGAMLKITASPVDDGDVQLILRDLTREVMLERKAQELEKMQVVGALAAGLAHNLNNIFASVLAHLFQLRDIVDNTEGIDLALRGGDIEYGRRHLGMAIAGAEQVAVLIERLLEFARPRQTHIETLDIGRLLEEQIELAKPLLGTGVEVDVDVRAGVHVRADRSIVVNALLNLLLNAAQAMSKQGRLTVRMGDGPGDEAWFEVRDSGVGMDAGTRSRLFEPFFTTKAAGTGLGLSTLHAGITSLEGRVEVDSSPGEGSAFTIYLPRVEPSPVGPPAARPRRDGRVLLAEDASVLRGFTARHLEESGWEVRAVASVRELAALVEEWPPEVAVVDWNLADGNAGGCVARLRGLGSRVVVLTGDPAAVDLEGVPVLAKPVDWNRLEELLHDAQR